MTSETTWTSTLLHKDLAAAKELVYDVCGLKCTQPIPEVESSEYGAYTFKIAGLAVKYRVAKVTPKKVGQFVTLWKRHDNGPIQPFDLTDDIDIFIVSTRTSDYFGQFIFPKAVLYEQAIVSGKNELSGKLKEGKRAIRVYPPWDKTVNKQAQKTQQWQLDYFVDIPQQKSVNLALAKSLFLGEP